MPEYDGNAYTILGDVREGLGEYSSDLVKGVDTSGNHSNTWIMKRINDAQRSIRAFLAPRLPEAFLDSTTITGVSSVYTLPWDFGSLVKFLDSDGHQIHRGNVDDLPIGGQEGSKYVYYRSGMTLVLTKSGVTDTCTLWYRRNPRDLHSGLTSAGAASSIKLDGGDKGKKVDDYYNGMIIEDITADFASTISDYTGSTRLAVITGTAVNSDYYGLVSELPEPFHHLIPMRALLLCKSQSPTAQEKPSRQEKDNYTEALIETTRAFAGQKEDVPISSLFDQDYEIRGGGVAIPGHTSLV